MSAELSLDSSTLVEFLHAVEPFNTFSASDLDTFIKILKPVSFKAGESVFHQGDASGCAFIVQKGKVGLEKHKHIVGLYNAGDVFGERRFLDGRARSGTAKVLEDAVVLKFFNADVENPELIPPQFASRLYKGLSQIATSVEREERRLYNEMDVLLVQDGGCAPGYNSVTAYITEYLESAGHKVFIAAEGFKSLVSGKTDDFRYLVYNFNLYRQVEHIHGVIFSPPLREARGADFRTERYKEFIQEEKQRLAAEHIIERKVKILIGIGGNGTLAGIKAMSKFLPKDVQIFFVPVTIDSDVHGTECIGQHTGVEVGAEKIRCYMADGRTHHRCYIIELMGASGGYHALHACLGAGAHLAVLPSSNYDPKKVADALKHRMSTVIVVAEGYKAKERKEKKSELNAAEYFYEELKSAGLDTRQRVICEGFSRDIRGARPNNMDIALAQRMSKKLSELITEGKTNMMPAVLAGQEDAIRFDDIQTDNTVEMRLASLANRLGV
jgi:6-phosphofructokinase